MKLTDLFKPKWKNSKINIRYEYINNNSMAENNLIWVIENDSEEKVCKAAINKLENTNYIANLILKDYNTTLKDVAFKRIINLQKSLHLIAKKSNDLDFKTRATNKLCDFNLLLDLLNTYDLSFKDTIQNIILDKFEKNAFNFEEVLQKNNDIELKLKVLGRVSDVNILNKILNNASDWLIRKQIYVKFNNEYIKTVIDENEKLDQKIKALKHLEEYDVAKAEKIIGDYKKKRSEKKDDLETIKDDSILSEIALRSKNQDIRLKSIKMIKNESYFSYIAKKCLNGEDETFMKALIKKLKNRQILEDIAFSNNSDFSRIEAFKSLNHTDGVNMLRLKRKLESKHKYDRVKAAEELVEIAKKNPDLLIYDWKQIETFCNCPHNDVHNHNEYAGEHYDFIQSDCNGGNRHSDGIHESEYVDTGIGIEFPPFAEREINLDLL